MKIKNIAKLASAIIICQLAGVIGSVFTSSSVQTWYTELTLPSFAPPGWFIGIVWITLYTLMGISLYLVWNKGLRNKRVKNSLYLFGLQLILNALWSILFFGLRSPLFGLIEIIILWAAIVLTILRFYKISKKAGLLLIPYIVWVSVALVLNFSIWWLNP
jgi:tryptophan-rich sensory protein